MIHICNWQKNYSATYLSLVPKYGDTLIGQLVVVS